MGLYVYGKTTKKEYSRAYSTLHTIRWLAVIACGAPIKFKNGDATYGWLKNCYSPIGQPTLEEISDFNYYLMLAGYHFPNLLFHSDASGSYTKKGKLFGKNWETGNSVKLFKELKAIKEELKDKVTSDIEHAYSALNELLEVVEDEVVNGTGCIFFR